MEEKVSRARWLIKDVVNKYGLDKVAVACSFGKDSMVMAHIAKEAVPNIKIFAVMTIFKPVETFEYLVEMNAKWNLGVCVYMVAKRPSIILSEGNVEVIYLPYKPFRKAWDECKPARLYDANPDMCCRLLKVEPTKVAVKDLDAWICGLRSTEGRTRINYQEIESKDGLIKVNPILSFTEAEVWRYMSTMGIKPHPWYGKGYRSLGCAPCSNPGGATERAGRWKGTSKCGGECGIHTMSLRKG